jgi:GNAT superfamily N-acetyltransferase
VTRFSDPEPLHADHDLAGFACGRASLDQWLARHALQAAAAGSARTYVIRDSQQHRVVGYHALTAAGLERESATARVIKGMPRYPIPAVLLARLAVDVSVTGRGLGAWLLRDAMLRTVSAAETIGVRAMLVHAQDQEARRFYLRHGLEPSPSDPLHLMILLKDIAASIRAASGDADPDTAPRGRTD